MQGAGQDHYVKNGANNLGGDGAWTYAAAIEKYETVTTAAGVLPAYVILLTEQTFSGTGSGEGGGTHRRSGTL